ncbi:cytochrome c [Lutibacter sp. HS1-25]|uniref:c-type cytochrome n=1 Tax=Lutibacter sp. HS1-25 TaxID=2485000 RepID=UPI0010120697|nr:c-type cytochrome [Lutibacter sp. HS1-25]RXP57062.1 cytochrome c [Lutibacter sp. HS1-25]
MKKTVFIVAMAALFLTSCGEKKQEKEVEVIETPEVETVEETVSAAVIVGDLELGKKLFTDKTCATCHQADAKLIGPSIKDINKVYTEQNADIVTFLTGNSAPIVDTDPGMVAIMKANLDGFVKDLSAEELASIALYMQSIK